MPQPLHDSRWIGAGHTLPVTLPSRLFDALEAAGLAPDPGRGLNSRTSEWASLRAWTLQGICHPEALDAERVFLCARGVRGRGEICVNGETAGAFSPGDWETEITAQALRKTPCDLSLSFSPQPPEGVPPRVALGADALYLRGVNQARLEDVHITPRIVDGYGVIEARTVLVPYVPGRYAFRYAVVREGETLATEEFSEKLSAVPSACLHRLVLPLPARWELGAPNAPYLLRLSVLRAGQVCDDRLVTCGFCEKRFAQSPAMQLHLDGRRVFLAGAQWRDDPAQGVADVEARLDWLQAAHINCLRVYGLPDERLCDALDARGMLLWPVLPLDTAAARQVIARVRHRPSLAAYGCEQILEAFNCPAGAHHPTVRALGALVDELDGAHPFFGPIPGGPVARPGRDDLGVGRCRDVWGPESYPGPESLCRDMNADDALIRTVSCPAPAWDLASLAGDQPFWPPEGPLWAHRAREALRLPALAEWFDADLSQPRMAVALARALQAETVRYAAERARLRQDRASGFFIEDPFERCPSLHSAALFDGDRPRPGWWALESALRPLHVCARLDSMGYYCDTSFEAQICLLCDRPVPGPLRVCARLHRADGSVLAEASFDALAETAALGALRATLPDHPTALVLRLTLERLGEVLDSNDYTICVALHALLWPLSHAPFAAVACRQGRMENTCGQTEYGVCAGRAAGTAQPGWSALLPGESREIHATREGLEGLNLEPGPSIL